MTTNKHYNIQTEESDFHVIIQLFSKNYRLFLFSVLGSLLLGFVVIHLITPKYKIASSLLIKEENRRQTTNVNEFLNSGLFGVNQNFQNELWVLKSNPVIEQTIQDLDLTIDYYEKKGLKNVNSYGQMPFKVLLMPNHVQPVGVPFKVSVLDNGHFIIRARGKDVSFVNFDTHDENYKEKKWRFERKGEFGKLIDLSEMGFMIVMDTNHVVSNYNRFGYSFILHDASSLTDKLKKELEFKIIDKQATVIQIVYKSPSVRKGKDVVNELMNVYSQQNLDRKNHSASITINYIEKQLDEISDSLNLTEDNLQRFRSSNQLLNPTEQASGISAQYLNLQNQMAELSARKRYYDYVADYLSKNDDFSNMIVPASMGIPDQLLNGLMSELITAQAQRSNLIQNNQELNPLVQRLTIQIENTKKTISENISAVRKTTDISIDEMNKRIRKVEATISQIPVTQRKLGGIERKYRLNDAIYNYLLEKRAEAKITQASNMPDDIIIEPAKLVGERPVSPNKQMVYLIALLLGTGIPFAYLSLRNSLENKIETQESIEKITNVQILGKILHNSRKNANFLIDSPRSVNAEAFRALRTNIEFTFGNLPKKTILVTSSIEGEGKSFIAQNLALSYALLGRKTLLIDFDLRKPCSYFGQENQDKYGLTEWYADGLDINSLIQKSPNEKLDFISSGTVSQNPIELLALGKTKLLINQFKENYDCVVMDTPPLAQVSDTYLLFENSDINLLVTRNNYSLRKVFSVVMKDLRQKNLKNIFIVMNDNKIQYDQYGYGYGYNKKK
jgi:tyrosine-protein kinase Etk/Wzc